jgi:hypothetical protein
MVPAESAQDCASGCGEVCLTLYASMSATADALVFGLSSAMLHPWQQPLSFCQRLCADYSVQTQMLGARRQALVQCTVLDTNPSKGKVCCPPSTCPWKACALVAHTLRSLAGLSFLQPAACASECVVTAVDSAQPRWNPGSLLTHGPVKSCCTAARLSQLADSC